jgi:hypothetical protein
VATHMHLPHAHVPHPHVELDVDAHPWRALPIALTMIVILAIILIAVCFELSKAFSGQAY